MYPTIRAGILFVCLLAMAPGGRAFAADDIQQAIADAVEYLKKSQHADGTWAFSGPHGEGSHIVGIASLAGLALLESDVPADDPVIRNAARVVRYGVIDCYETYDLSLAIMFLDRLRGSGDDELISAAARRLLSGQNKSGGWGYVCPLENEADLRRLRTQVQKNTPKEDRLGADSDTPRPGRVPEVQPLFRPAFGQGLDDNSNTQFATLALWIARRHNLRVDRPLAAVESRFRKSQNSDGGLGYWPGGGFVRGLGMNHSTVSMTCSGLLGLAVGYGVEAVMRTGDASKRSSSPSRDKRSADPTRDPSVRLGLQFLGKNMELALGVPDDFGDRPRRKGGGRRATPRGRGEDILGNHLSSEYYFLWSLERVAVLYGLDKINKKDWFAIGSNYLLDTQGRDGAWVGNCGATVDTCFGLFFLRRANLARDLTATLRSKSSEISLKTQQEKESAGKTPAPADNVQTTRKESAPPPPAEPKTETPALPSPPSTSSAPKAAPPVPTEHQAKEDIATLRDELVHASGADLDGLLQRERDGKGSVHTEVLASAIPLLRGNARQNARDALAERIARMTAATLRDKLQDGDAEIRRATSLACAMKREKGLVQDLIPLLNDPDTKVVRATNVALKKLTNEDFGPKNAADKKEREQAIARWRDWQSKNGKTT